MAHIRPTISFVPAIVGTTSVCEGWVLKKRRKKMQGFARRYFILSQAGVLSYSFGPNQPIRDQIALPNAAISTSPGRKDIHVDSNNATFHIKCLSTEDFNKWMAAFRKFIVLGTEARRSASMRMAPRVGNVNVIRTSAIADDMGKTLTELEHALQALSSQQEPPNRKSNSPSKGKSDKLKDPKETSSVFGLFKKPSSHPLPTEMGEQVSGGSRRYASSMGPSPIERLETALNTLRTQHAALCKTLHGFATADSSAAPTPPLSSTAEEEEPSALQNSITSWRSQRTSSLATSASEANEWFDALDGIPDGPHEFVVETTEPTEMEQEDRPQSTKNDSSSTLPTQYDSSEDTDVEDEESPRSPIEATVKYTELPISRRTTLPAPQPADEGSLFAVLKKNVGKDLSAISFPITFNEPLTMLQRAAEELEYYDLLTQAAAAEGPTERMALVAAFAVSSYAHTRHRSGRKGFNPMLAETFEDHRMKLIAEKVCHQPLIIAQHAEGAHWQLTATTIGKTKFWGKSLEIIPLGVTHVQIGDDHYHWRKPSSFVRNLMVGNKYLEHVGKLTIENKKDKTLCVLDFKQSGYWGPSNVVSGVITTSSGQVLSELEGRWDESLSQKLDASTLRVLWRAAPFPKTTQDYYGFTFFTFTLNEITPDMKGKLAPTDSRLRPDVRALEEGRLDNAEEEKVRIEELQRERRRGGADVQPRWFRKIGSGEDHWEYTGGYWESRARGWKDSKIDSLW